MPRLLEAMERRGLDGIVCSLRQNVFYLTGYQPHSSMTLPEGECFSAAVVSRRGPDHAVLIVADALLSFLVEHPTWVTDVRAVPTFMLPHGLPADHDAFDRFVPRAVAELPFGANARAHYADDLLAAIATALRDLDLVSGRVGFDDPRMAAAVTNAAPGLTLREVDAYGALRWTRQVKTAEELQLLTRSAAVNREAIERMTRDWAPGARWSEMIHAYHVHAVELGGFFREPGAVVLANPPSDERATYMSSGADFEVKEGTSMMLDCHGTVNHYCWDGGRTWVVAGTREGVARQIEHVCVETAHQLEATLRPGAHISAVTESARAMFQRSGLADAPKALVFLHGLGIDHLDVELPVGRDRQDWTLEENMVLAVHVLFPSDDRHRFYIEDTVRVRPAGGESLYAWPLTAIEGAA